MIFQVWGVSAKDTTWEREGLGWLNKSLFMI